MKCLSQLGVHPLILAWLCSYLSNRQRFVCVNGESSQSIALRSGVPQGSVLGHLLFLVYVNDITKLVLSSFKSKSLRNSSYEELQQDIDRLLQWSDNHVVI